MTILEDVRLAPYTTLGVGGPARWLVEAGGEADILAALRFSREQHAPCFILGGGSNLLVSDEGFPGVVIHVGSPDVECAGEADGKTRILAGAGTNWDDVVQLAVDKDLAGIECLAGIPGSVGGTPVQNVGAYGQEVSHTIVSVRAIDLADGRVADFDRGECGFSYRRSIFNTTHKGRYAITQVEYSLEAGGMPHLQYRDVQQYFVERAIAQPSLAQTAAAVREIRARKGMLLDENDPDSRSAGSFFKNPVVPAAQLQRLAVLAGCRLEEVPQFPAGLTGDMVKLSAAWLMELAGFYKGFAIGRAGLSHKHVLAVINRGGATAAEIVALRDAVISAVEVHTGIRLEQEPVMLGFPGQKS